MIALESTESEWVACHFESLEHEVIVADPNFAPMYATRDKRIKTDKRDARTLCEACRLGAYRFAHRISERQRKIRAQLLVRSTLARTRSKYISLIDSLARREGCRIPTGSSNNFIARVESAGLPAHVLEAIAPLFESLRLLNQQITEADAQLEKIVKEDEGSVAKINNKRVKVARGSKLCSKMEQALDKLRLTLCIITG